MAIMMGVRNRSIIRQKVGAQDQELQITADEEEIKKEEEKALKEHIPTEPTSDNDWASWHCTICQQPCSSSWPCDHCMDAIWNWYHS